MPILLVFLDGVGVGPPGPQNPFSETPSALFAPLGGRGEGELPRGGRLALADATLSIEGLPQSATGGTALFTGENAPARLGHHLQGFPNEALCSLIAERGLLGRARALGARVAFANAYTPAFFESAPPPGVGCEGLRPGVRARASGRRPRSVTTVVTLSAGLSLKTLEDLRRGEALYRDFTNALLVERGHAVELRSPEEAGRLLARLAEAHDL
ncbi:MAG: peptidase, partial [Nitrospinota bacterium]